MRTETISLSPNYPDCQLISYIHDDTPELNMSPRRAIVVCPGGGYEFLSDREAEPVALQYFAAGLNVFILRYSVAPHAAHFAPLIEAGLAIKHIRDRAEDYHVDPAYVFITGFSAGGHLAASAGTLWNHPAVREALGDAPEGINRPTATVLCYPVISGGPLADRGSINALCGSAEAGSEGTEGARQFSLELHVDATTAPAFIWHTFNDPCVPVQNSLMYADALTRAGVPFELHIFPDGNHGLSLCNTETWSKIPSHVNPTCSIWIREAIRYVTEFKA